MDSECDKDRLRTRLLQQSKNASLVRSSSITQIPTMSTIPKLERAPIRRVMTGHTPEGKSIVVEDAPVQPHTFRVSPTLLSDLFWTDQAPASNDVEFKDLVKDHPEDLFPSEGSSFKCVEMPPGAKAPFHRTVSIDYCVLTHGELTLILDDEQRVTLYPGDTIVQRGAIHGWENNGTEWTRLYCVMLPAKPVKIGNKELGADVRVPSVASQKK